MFFHLLNVYWFDSLCFIPSTSTLRASVIMLLCLAIRFRTSVYRVKKVPAIFRNRRRYHAHLDRRNQGRLVGGSVFAGEWELSGRRKPEEEASGEPSGNISVLGHKLLAVIEGVLRIIPDLPDDVIGHAAGVVI